MDLVVYNVSPVLRLGLSTWSHDLSVSVESCEFDNTHLHRMGFSRPIRRQ